MASPNLPALVSRYASRVHDVIGEAHHVASPLGAWLLLALIGPLAPDSDRLAIEEVLGCAVAQGRELADGLLASPHEVVGAALAGWADLALVGDSVAAWLDALPPDTDRGPIPTQDEADRWALNRTFGLIERFPVTLDPETILVLASALAAKVTWWEPFELRPSSELGGPYSASVEHVLHTGASHETWLASTSEARQVAVVAKAADGLRVLAVLAEPGVPAGAVLAAAHELSSGPDHPRRVSLFDVALGDGPLGTITERRYRAVAHNDRIETAEGWLPCWEATSDHDLMVDQRLGFATASEIVNRWLPLTDDGYRFEARQSAMARYTRLGFEAAAVTAMAAMAGGMMPAERKVTERHLAVRFDRPFAVVATAQDTFATGGPSPWSDVPVFSAWVTEAIDPPD